MPVTPSKLGLMRWVAEHRALPTDQLLAELTGVFIAFTRAVGIPDHKAVEAVRTAYAATKPEDRRRGLDS